MIKFRSPKLTKTDYVQFKITDFNTSPVETRKFLVM